MKKVMFMLGTVALAACAQAASFQWVSSTAAYGVAAATLANLENGTVYGVGSASTERMRNQTAVTWAYELILAATDGSGATDTLTGTPVFGSTGKLNLTGANVLSSDLAVPGDTLNYTLVFTGTYTDANEVEWTLTSNTISDTWTVNEQGDPKLTTAVPTSWTATSAATPTPDPTPGVPEPTSGLLMLVGLGALALRRRR